MNFILFVKERVKNIFQLGGINPPTGNKGHLPRIIADTFVFFGVSLRRHLGSSRMFVFIFIGFGMSDMGCSYMGDWCNKFNFVGTKVLCFVGL